MKLRALWNLTVQQKQLFCISFLLCGIARAAIVLFNYRRLTFYYGHFCRMTVASSIISPEQCLLAWKIRRAIELAANYTPWDSGCLTQAIVAKFWCHYYQIPYMFFIGFAKHSKNPLGTDAHAWLTAGPIAITGGHSLNTHQVVYSYSNLTFNVTTYPPQTESGRVVGKIKLKKTPTRLPTCGTK